MRSSIAGGELCMTGERFVPDGERQFRDQRMMWGMGALLLAPIVVHILGTATLIKYSFLQRLSGRETVGAPSRGSMMVG